MNLFEKQSNEFADRHIGPNEHETKEMLQEIGMSSLEELVNKTVPTAIRIKGDLDITPAISEFEYLNELKKVAAKNKVYKSYIGCGYYDTIVPGDCVRFPYTDEDVIIKRPQLTIKNSSFCPIVYYVMEGLVKEVK